MGVAVARVEAREVVVTAVETLGLDAAAMDLLSPEVLAACIRRAASVLCPTTRGTLIRSVTEALAPLPHFSEDHSGEVVELVDSLVAHGDLLELPFDGSGGTRRQLFLGPPAFVPRDASCILVGVRPDGAPLVGDELAGRVEYRRHVRLVRLGDDDEPLAERLAEEGLLRVTAEQWLRAPRPTSPESVVDEFTARLAARPPTGDLEGLRLIDPAADVSYYRGRWRPPRPDDRGRFVARRPQAYGAELWCFASLTDGAVTQILDLPVLDALAPGSDEAWLLQAAIDAAAGRPQRLQVRAGAHADVELLDLFGPIPRWAQRRLDVAGVAIARGPRALFSYQLPADESQGEVEWLREMLWMTVSDARPST